VQRRILWYAAVVLGLILAGETLYRMLAPPAGPEGASLRIGVLPFDDATHEAAVADWSITLQRLLASELTGTDNLGVMDPLSLNSLLENVLSTAYSRRGEELYKVIRKAKIAFIIDGMIIRSGSAYHINSTVIDASNGEICCSVPALAAGIEDLPKAVDTVCRQILRFFDVKVLHLTADNELRPWLLHRTQNMEALKAFSQAYQMQYNEKSESAKYLRRAIEIDSTFVSPRIWLISMLVGQNKFREANEHYNTLRRLESWSSPFEQAMINWTGVFISNDLQAQEHYLESALKFSPGNNILLYNIARTRYLRENFTGAVEAILPAVEMKWRYSSAYCLLGECYDALGEYGKARDVLEQSLSVTPVFPDILSLLFTLELREEDTVKAAGYRDRFLERSREEGRSPGRAYESLATLCTFEGFHDEASRYFRAALALEPDVAAYHEGLGEALFKRGNTAAAEGECLRALELDSTLAHVHLMLGKMYESQGRKAEALHHYREYLKRDSTSAPAAEVTNAVNKLNH